MIEKEKKKGRVVGRMIVDAPFLRRNLRRKEGEGEKTKECFVVEADVVVAAAAAAAIMDERREKIHPETFFGSLMTGSVVSDVIVVAMCVFVAFGCMQQEKKVYRIKKVLILQTLQAYKP